MSKRVTREKQRRARRHRINDQMNDPNPQSKLGYGGPWMVSHVKEEG